MTKPIKFSNEAELTAARNGDSINKFLCGHNVTTSYAVQTDAGIVYNIPAGKQVIITKACYGLVTASDNMGMYLVACDAVDGGGTPTQLTHCFCCANGSVPQGTEQFTKEFHPPLCIKYSDGNRSISVAAMANDTAADLCLAWHGWVETE